MEYDALPGLGHACGHNAHCAMAVLAALALADLKDRFQGTVYVFGTPAEEEAVMGWSRARRPSERASMTSREVITLVMEAGYILS